MTHREHRGATGDGARDSILIRPAAMADCAALAQIYNPYVRETSITFEEVEVSETEMAARLRDTRAASLPWLVAQAGAQVIGYAYAAKWRTRSAYRFATEVTVYLERARRGEGVGSLLMAGLIAALRERGMHSAIGGIALPNDASVALHEKFGFRKVALFEQVGFKLERWIDVGYWQLML